MKLLRFESWSQRIPLTRPYTIASSSTDQVELVFVRAIGERGSGVGSGAPVEGITGETLESCLLAASVERLAPLLGRDTDEFDTLSAELAHLTPLAPAARAALDMALHDLVARERGLSVLELLGGRRCQNLPTSITIGIGEREQALAEVDEYLGRGFRCLKVKIGRDVEADIERLRAIRERAGVGIALRVDANEGYTLEQAVRLASVIEELRLELVEQPLPASARDQFAALPEPLRRLMALDESVHDAADAGALLSVPGSGSSFVVKLMKCGGIRAAAELARVAEAGARRLMWGCMDESVIGIAAGLHAAYATRATAWLDLDGSFDLARDPGSGGFALVDGELRLLDRPGLGVELADT